MSIINLSIMVIYFFTSSPFLRILLTEPDGKCLLSFPFSSSYLRVYKSQLPLVVASEDI